METHLSIENLSKYERLINISSEVIERNNQLGLQTRKNPRNSLIYPPTCRIHNEGDTFIYSKNGFFSLSWLTSRTSKTRHSYSSNI